MAPERYKIQFTISAGTHAKLRQPQTLLRHSLPSGDPAEIFDRAVTMLLDHVQRTKLAATDRPGGATPRTKKSRHIPAAVRREVWTRDGGQCAFIGTHGRCGETGFLEFHHVEPYAVGGGATSQNVQLRCKAHNQHEAELFFGRGDPMLVRETREVFWTSPGSGQTEFGFDHVRTPMPSWG